MANSKAEQLDLTTITYDWLTSQGVKLSKDYCKQEIATHADYPALTSIVDFLDAGNMGYQAVEADASYIHEFNYPALAHIKQVGNEYMHIIPNAKAWDTDKEITQHWSGVTIFPDKNTNWSNTENDDAIKKENNKRNIFIAWCAIGLVAFVTSIYFNAAFWYNVFGALSLIGVFVSIAAFATELGIQSAAIKQVCGVVSKGGCDTVLKSKLAKGIWGITPSDIAVVYFVAQFLLYLLAAFSPSLFGILPYIALLGITIVAVSIYTQAEVIKQWCALCLGIATILVLQIIASLFLLETITVQSIIVFALLFTIVLVALLPIKNMVKQAISNAPKLAELKRWQTDATLFNTLLQKEQAVDTTIWENDLVLGVIDAPIMITVACNPYCGPCARAHKELDEMLEKYASKIKVQVRLLFNQNIENDKLTTASKAILQQTNKAKNNKEIQQILTDWFEWMDLEKWRKKYNGINNEDNRIKNLLNMHTDWITESDIKATPTFFINSNKLPSRYSLKDLQKIIPSLTDEIK